MPGRSVFYVEMFFVIAAHLRVPTVIEVVCGGGGEVTVQALRPLLARRNPDRSQKSISQQMGHFTGGNNFLKSGRMDFWV